MRGALLLLLCWPAWVQGQNFAGVKVLPGFRVTEFADATLANDIFCMTLDPIGRVVVAGRGYIRLLLDEDGDGKADRAVEFANEPKDGAMGLLWEGDTLFVTGDGGLRRFTDANRDGKADGPSVLVRAMKTGGEHCAHDIRRGPDGWLYVLCGNTTGINASYVQSKSSPIQNPIAGCVLRFSPDLKTSEIVAHGFRNPYGMDFNSRGQLFTYDSDNERCIGLPWYEFTRFYRVEPGGFYGWFSPHKGEFWRLPPYHPNVVAPLALLGRGSPTGVACYRHTQFPEAFRDGFFLCDWTFGKIYFVPVRQREGTYEAAQLVTFLEPVGDLGFAPTSIAVHPKTGDLFVSIGGRGTRGGVYRISFDRSTTNFAAPNWPHAERRNAALDEICRLQGETPDPAFRGTLWEGYRRKTRAPLPKVPERAFPSGEMLVDREFARLHALIGQENDTFRAQLLACFRENSHPSDDVHFLAVYASIPGNRDVQTTAKIADVLIQLDAKLRANKITTETHWPLRMRELYDGLAEHDPSLHQAVANHPQFGRPEHAIWTRGSGFPKAKAAARFLTAIQGDPAYPLNASILELLSSLPQEKVHPLLRQRWGETGSDSAILKLLARQPLPEDRPRFRIGLQSGQSDVLRASLAALELLGPNADHEETLALLLCWKRLPENAKDLANEVFQRLRKNTQQELPRDIGRWIDWLRGQDAKLAVRLTNPDGVDVDSWTKRLAQVDWTAGDATQGIQAFQKASCNQCHGGNQAIGPDLAGVAGRMSREDFFTAILQPSRDVADRYQLTFVETHQGKQYQGVVIYDAFDSLILHTGPATTQRIAGEQIAARRRSPISLMPPGLLDRLSNAELADLYAYVRTLGKGK